jgi:hypothetical protein
MFMRSKGKCIIPSTPHSLGLSKTVGNYEENEWKYYRKVKKSISGIAILRKQLPHAAKK